MNDHSHLLLNHPRRMARPRRPRPPPSPRKRRRILRKSRSSRRWRLRRCRYRLSRWCLRFLFRWALMRFKLS